MTAPDLTVVIVNWNTVGLLDDCLRSLDDHGPPPGAHRGRRGGQRLPRRVGRAPAAQQWPAVRVIANDENVGFCRANNQAIRGQHRCAYLLLINTDARLHRGLPRPHDRAASRRDPRAGVIGPRLVYGDGSFQRWTAGRELSLAVLRQLLPAAGPDGASAVPAPGRHLPALRHRRALPTGLGVERGDGRCGATPLDDVGLLDERIFVYMDDVDLCRRMTDGGWNVWYEADATAVHFMGASTRRQTGKASPEALRAFNR